MNYLDEGTTNALAAEYVLGTLRGLPRQRFQKLMMQHEKIAQSTFFWEQSLNGLGQQLPPVTPDKKVWDSIAEKLGFTQAISSSPDLTNLSAVKTDNVDTQKKPAANDSLWRMFSLAASAAVVVLAIMVARVDTPIISEPQQLAVVNGADQELLWAIEVAKQEINVRATTQLQAKLNKDYQLWIVPADGGAPISLGLLPKSGQLSLAKPDFFENMDIAALAVSLEPLGGSPNGSPTEVLYAAKLVVL